jgi:hypothetical protein
MAHMLAMECRVVAHRVISRARNDEVAFGVKRTSMGGQGWVAQSRMTLNGHEKGFGAVKMPSRPASSPIALGSA